MENNNVEFVAAFLLVLFAGPALLIALNIYRAGTPTQIGTSYALCDFIESRRALARTKDEPHRVLFFGLSNVMTGLRSNLASTILKRPVVNFGMNANLTNSVLYDFLEQVLKAGDTLVIILPYFYYADGARIDEQFSIVRDYIFDCSPTAYKRLSAYDFLRLSLAQRPAQVLEGVLRKIQLRTGLDLGRRIKPPFPMFDAAVKGAALDGDGDWTLNAESQRPTDHRAIVERSSITRSRGFDAADVSVVALRDFLIWAKSKDIKLVASWPIFYAHDRNGLDQLAQQIREFYRQNNVPIVGQLEDFLYPVDDFFNSAYHPTAEGAEIYTRELANELLPLLTQQGATD